MLEHISLTWMRLPLAPVIASGMAVQQLDSILPVAAFDHVVITAYPSGEVAVPVGPLVVGLEWQKHNQQSAVRCVAGQVPVTCQGKK